ncbi:hypothetical protein EDC01DRAFT_64736 [Geopyxis carbonaria]|nr:hypothetical protein EDC01DRAFT_64736 [Geopyxis carbonaria]
MATPDTSSVMSLSHTRPTDEDQFTLHSRWRMNIPTTDICTWLFTSPTHPLPTTPLYFDTEKPSTHNLSLTTYRNLVLRLARGLRTTAGLGPGDRVLMFSGNNVYFPSVYLGVVAAGCIFTGANPGYTARELAFQLKDSGATCVIANAAVIDTTVAACREVGVPLSRVFAFDDSLLLGASNGGGPDRWVSPKSNLPSGIRHWSALVADQPDWKWEVFTTEEQTHTTCVINYSSGTTGVPKGVELTHRNFISNTSQVVHVSHLSPTLRALPHRWIGALPMYHAYGQTYFTLLVAALNIPVYILSTFTFPSFLSALATYRITTVAGVPPILTALAKHPLVDTVDLSSLRTLGSGAAPLSATTEAAVSARLKLPVRQGWGMTEATCSILGHHPEDEGGVGSVGELMPNCTARIIDRVTGTPLPAGAHGELIIQAPNVCKGYWRNPTATADAFLTAVDGKWLKTGDIAYYDPAGKFYIVDRAKELIKVRGNQVAPAEIEGVLLECVGVADAAVVGVSVDVRGGKDELVRAYVARPVGGSITAQEVEEWVKTRCARWKWITGGVRFVDAVPRNASGKIMRKVLKDMVAADGPEVKAKL